jgi:hypothetical protein
MSRKAKKSDIPAVTHLRARTDANSAPRWVNSEDLFIKDFAPDFTIWRYMDMVRFVSLLSNQALWFSRADLLDDAHEITHRFPGLDGADRDSLLTIFRHSRRFAHVNSWHAAEHESMAMWEIYAARQQGIAIKSSAAILCQNFQKPHGHYGRAAKVQYGEPTDPLTIPYLAFWKRSAFEFEQEFRILLVNKRESSQHLNDMGTYDPPIRESMFL